MVRHTARLSQNPTLCPVEGGTHIIGLQVAWVESGAVAGVATCLGLLPKSIFFDLLLPSHAWTSVKVTIVQVAHQGIHTLLTGLSCLFTLVRLGPCGVPQLTDLTYPGQSHTCTSHVAWPLSLWPLSWTCCIHPYPFACHGTGEARAEAQLLNHRSQQSKLGGPQSRKT